jgi:hypothetical protein
MNPQGEKPIVFAIIILSLYVVEFVLYYEFHDY